MNRVIVLLFVLISFGMTEAISAPQVNQNLTARRTESKSKRALKLEMNARAESRSKSLVTWIMNDSVSVGPVHADKRNKSFYWPDCSKFEKIPMKDRLVFGNNEEAEGAGYKPAKDCYK